MPIVPTYPGVYVEEDGAASTPSPALPRQSPRSVGRTRRGPADRPVRIQSFAEFERRFEVSGRAAP